MQTRGTVNRMVGVRQLLASLGSLLRNKDYGCVATSDRNSEERNKTNPKMWQGVNGCRDGGLRGAGHQGQGGLCPPRSQRQDGQGPKASGIPHTVKEATPLTGLGNERPTSRPNCLWLQKASVSKCPQCHCFIVCVCARLMHSCARLPEIQGRRGSNRLAETNPALSGNYY